ncbi:hypothetical protein FS749_001614 [Ceratobasidium sp. UAMH 11750]|nr:hypothetical protein FS749_001614 [Ceratobasidium sp. UAMH 11750]
MLFVSAFNGLTAIFVQFQQLLHPEVRWLLPCRATVSRDVKTIHKAAQQGLVKTLAEACGVFHLGPDMYQVANGIDILWLVSFCQFVTKSHTMIVKRCVLECLNFEPKHTSVELAKGVYGVLHKFKIEDHVWGVVCDNTSNNAAMMDQFACYGMKRLVGPAAWGLCMLHMLNLAAQNALKPFCKTQKQLEAERDAAGDQDDASKDEYDIEQAVSPQS